MPRDSLDRTLTTQEGPIAGGVWRKSYASLVVVQGAEIGRDFPLRNRSMVIGRGLETDVRLLDDLASREHARVEAVWDPEGGALTVYVFDLGSTNHTFVNSHRIDRAELHDGDKIQVGETVLKFEVLDEIEARFHAEIRQRISYDQLTGLLTKESLFLALEHELKRSARYSLPLSVLMMDLDHFKSVNDIHGHLMGSHVISEVGRIIRESIRSVDVSARFGGEEFVSYLRQSPLAAAHLVAERLRREVESHLFTQGAESVQTTLSIGVASFPEHGRTVEALVDSADRALYSAKNAGRNRIAIASVG